MKDNIPRLYYGPVLLVGLALSVIGMSYLVAGEAPWFFFSILLILGLILATVSLKRIIFR